MPEPTSKQHHPETERPHATVATIICKNERYLLVKEIRGGKLVYNQPAGHIENGESIVDAAIRETLEETGWHITPTAVSGISMYHAANGISYLRCTLIADAIELQPNAELDDGIVEAVWLSYEEIVTLEAQLRSPMVLKVIEDYRQGIRYPLDLVCRHS